MRNYFSHLSCSYTLYMYVEHVSASLQLAYKTCVCAFVCVQAYVCVPLWSLTPIPSGQTMNHRNVYPHYEKTQNEKTASIAFLYIKCKNRNVHSSAWVAISLPACPNNLMVTDMYLTLNLWGPPGPFGSISASYGQLVTLTWSHRLLCQRHPVRALGDA